MEGPAPADRMEELLAHRAWVRRVARALVTDENRADDLEQEAWLRTLQGARPRSPRAWFGTVLRHLASNAGRGERRRALRESWGSAAAPPPAPEDLLQRAEIVERVARAVRTLEEPSRTAILLRYFEDLPPPAIAERLGVPLETVRARLRRGLARLRERLDEEHEGQRRMWLPLLFPLAADPPSPGSGVPAGVVGGALMTLKAKAAIAAAVVLLAAGAFLWSGSGNGSGSGGGPGAAPPHAVPPMAVAPPAPAAPAPVEVPPIVEETAQAVPARILVLDPDGKPVAGAAVERLTAVPVGGVGVVVPDPVPVGRTDAHGRTRWPEGRIDFPCIVRAMAAEHAPGESAAASRESDVVVRLRRGCEILGRVETADGVPVEGATVAAQVLPMHHVLGPHMGVTGTWTREARSGADGRFRVRGLPPAGAALLTARAAGFLEARVDWRPTSGLPARIVLERPFRAAVRVRDRSGQPLDGASVWAFAGPRIRLRPSSVPDADVVPMAGSGQGLYARDDLAPGWYSVLVARAGHRLAVEEDAAFGGGLGPVEVVLEEVPGLRGRVVWGDTKVPVAGVKVRATPLKKTAPGAPQEGADAWAWPVREMEGPFVATSGEDGSYVLPVFGPADRFKIDARGPDGEWGFSSHPPNGQAEAAEILDVWLHRMRKDVDYAGRVLSLDGTPIPGALVQGGESVVAAGEDGRFRLSGRQAGSHLMFLAPGFHPRTVFAPGSRTREGGFGAKEFGDVRLAPLREIRGRVVDAAGAPVPGAMLWARSDDRMLFRDYEFTGSSGLSDAEGGVVLRVVPGFRYSVGAFAGGGGSVEVAGDSEEEFRFAVDAAPGAGLGSLRGRLRLADGTWKPIRVAVHPRSESGAPSGGLTGPVAPDGSFRIEGLPAGSWALRVAGSPEIEGEVAGVRVLAGATAEVEIPCRRAIAEDAPPAEVRVRPDPAAPERHRWKAFATPRPAGESAELLPGTDGTWKGSVRPGGRCVAWVLDGEGLRAGIAEIPAGSADVPTIALVPAGRLALPGWEYGTPPPRIEVRDAAGTLLYAGLETALPVVADLGPCLVLPPGAWRVDLAASGKEPRTFTVTAVSGETARLR